MLGAHILRVSPCQAPVSRCLGFWNVLRANPTRTLSAPNHGVLQASLGSGLKGTEPGISSRNLSP